MGREWRAAGFNPWVSGASEVTGQLCPRRDDSDRFTGVFSWSSEPCSKDSNLELLQDEAAALLSSPVHTNSKKQGVGFLGEGVGGIWTGSRMP